MKNKSLHENPSLTHPDKAFLFYSSDETLACHSHWHNETEFLFFESEGIVTYGNDSITVKENSLITVNKNESHSVEKGRFSCLTVLNSFFEDTYLPQNTCFVRQIENDPFINETFCKLEAEYKTQQSGYEMQIKSIIYALLTYLLRNYSAEKTTYSDANVNKHYHTSIIEITDFIEKNYNTPISTSQIAKQFHITVNYLCYIFKIHTGYTVVEYINIRRIVKSTKLLINKKKSITEVAQAVGFDDSSYYARVFKKQMGVTPSEYRKNHL